MNSFLIDRNSPIRSNITTKLRHRSSHSESENIASDNPFKNDQDENKSDASRNYTRGSESHEGTSNKTEKKSVKSKSMLGYFMTELTRDYKLEGDASEFVERRDRVYTSVNTPKNLEKFCAFGFLQCLDSILYMVTFLPLRIIVALARVLTYPCTVIFIGDRRILDGAQICDLLKGLILVISCFITSYMDMSMIYHIVRGQSIIKFYVFYNMLDVMDKLVSGFGQDVLDSLYWTAVEPRGRKREHFGTIFHLLFAIAYVIIHTVMILIQAIILNVAFNSHNKNLLTIMMSNNFVEIKGNLFKRLDKNNLCQITYSDVKERFHYLVLLLFVFIRNMKELQWKWDMAFPIIQDAAIVMLVEVIVDWIKHAFITKFNELSASSYADFALGLAQDIASSQKKHAFTNFSDQVCRRMGFTPMPLICLLFMVCTKSFNIKGSLAWLLVLLFYLCLISTKILNSIILLGWAQRLITERDKNAQSTGLVVNSQVVPKKEEKSSQPKPKNEINFDLKTKEKPARPAAESSSVAVNTEPTLFTDASSFVYVSHSVQNTIVKNENLIADIDSVVIGTGSTDNFSDNKNSLDNLSDHQLSSLSANASSTSQPDSFTTYSEHEVDIKTNLVKPCAQIDLLLDQLQIDISPLSPDKLKEHPVDMGAVEPTTKTSAVDYNNLFESMGDSKRN
ncbi:Transmembrane anterior posterior transformation protein 1 [Bulinus truncatus]|nr:Transmembrane anterior posterior transformation protein 1 [Bulinus truncatus]